MDKNELWNLCTDYKIQQKKTEFLWLIEQIETLGTDLTGLIIGEYDGGSSAGLSFISSQIITLDISPQRFLTERFNSNCYFTYIQGDSHHLESKHKVVQLLKRPLDYLFLDGDHKYWGAKQDFDMYSELVKKDGIIALHDIAVHRVKEWSGVDCEWQELKQVYNTEEMIDSPSDWGGIGIVRVV
jgi:predicted O-methyltransferase YrrM